MLLSACMCFFVCLCFQLHALTICLLLDLQHSFMSWHTHTGRERERYRRLAVDRVSIKNCCCTHDLVAKIVCIMLDVYQRPVQLSESTQWVKNKSRLCKCKERSFKIEMNSVKKKKLREEKMRSQIQNLIKQTNPNKYDKHLKQYFQVPISSDRSTFLHWMLLKLLYKYMICLGISHRCYSFVFSNFCRSLPKQNKLSCWTR